eukprot:TRINITY_DN55280_c0_g1_i1.p1 TRINITY_DN55280_c0_g1~~TRINITY_DN55280_c0_g1_i1.p1  ORF type:complete len:446 (-),score=51.03 TRINITY_DN55280_c0_g1_i1:149-1486(-)
MPAPSSSAPAGRARAKRRGRNADATGATTARRRVTGRISKTRKHNPNRQVRAKSRPAPSASAREEPVDAESIGAVCPICHETYSASTFPVVHAPCGHVACGYCTLRWQEKKTAKTCAICRQPVLTIAHCQLLEQLIERETKICGGDPAADSPQSSEEKIREERDEVKRGLQALNQGDLNNVDGEYRVDMIKQVLHRSIRKGDFSMFESCVKTFKARASTKLICDVAEMWTADPKPVLALLLAKGARVNGHCMDRPLVRAAYVGNIKMIRALIDAKADPARQAGATPLHAAVRTGRFDAVRLLLDSGAPIDVKDADDQTPLAVAKKGLDMHRSECTSRRCERCDARVSVHRELQFRANAQAVSSTASAAQDEPQENDTASEDSSSYSDGSEMSVSDVEDMSEEVWSQEEGEEEGSEYMADEDEEGTDDEDDEDTYVPRHRYLMRGE